VASRRGAPAYGAPSVAGAPLLHRCNMNRGRAALLALFGWYLMVPPPVVHNRLPVDLEAHLSEWRLFSTHDSAAECEQGLVAFYKAAKAELLAHPADESDRTRFYQLESSQCVSSDDPRLKEK
jgi:hypothetical protein